MSKLKKLVIFLLVLVIGIPAAAYGYVYFKLNKMHDSNADNEILNNTDYKSEEGIINILLAGTDGRSKDEQSRSDSMMILTIDNVNKNLRLTSLARDSYVDIPGYGKQKLTHAYIYGGVNLLIETIEKNFELDIQNYAVVDFFSFMDIVDAVGGVSVDVASSEIEELSHYTRECYNLSDNPKKGKLEIVNSPGVQNLKGYQALAFARIRYNDSAFERDRRQRALIQGLTDSIKELPLSKYPKLVDTVLPYVKTNMKPGEIIKVGTQVLSFGNLDINQMEFPVDDGINSTGGILGSAGWVLQFDPDSLEILHNFIFKNTIE